MAAVSRFQFVTKERNVERSSQSQCDRKTKLNEKLILSLFFGDNLRCWSGIPFPGSVFLAFLKYDKLLIMSDTQQEKKGIKSGEGNLCFMLMSCFELNERKFGLNKYLQNQGQGKEFATQPLLW